MVGKHETTIQVSSPASSTNGHPTRCKCFAGTPKKIQPFCVFHSWRSYNDRITPVPGFTINSANIWKLDARLRIERQKWMDRIMSKNGADGGIKPSQDPLGLSQRVGKKHGRHALSRIFLPPVIDLGMYFLLRLPAINRKAKSTFTDETITRNEFEGLAGLVGLRLVIATDDPNRTTNLNPHLSGTKDMPRRMEGETGIPNGY